MEYDRQVSRHVRGGQCFHSNHHSTIQVLCMDAIQPRLNISLIAHGIEQICLYNNTSWQGLGSWQFQYTSGIWRMWQDLFWELLHSQINSVSHCMSQKCWEQLYVKQRLVIFIFLFPFGELLVCYTITPEHSCSGSKQIWIPCIDIAIIFRSPTFAWQPCCVFQFLFNSHHIHRQPATQGTSPAWLKWLQVLSETSTQSLTRQSSALNTSTKWLRRYLTRKE